MLAGDGGIVGFVDFAPTPINKIAQRFGLTIAKISAMLIRVELRGLVKPAPVATSAYGEPKAE